MASASEGGLPATRWTAETADWYAATFGEYATNRLTFDQLIQDSILTETTPTVVDIGCGTGCALRRVAYKLPSCRLIGLEPTPRMLETARQRAQEDKSVGGRLDLRPGGAEELSLEDVSADVVLAFDVLDHVSNLSKALKEMCRILKPGTGHLAIVKDGRIGEGDNWEETLEAAKVVGMTLTDRHNLEEGEVTLVLVVLRKH